MNTSLSATHHVARRAQGGQAGELPTLSPLYKQIKTLLVDGLRKGLWRPGEAIPSEIELAAQYGVSQGTVRKAIRELAADNLLVRQQGRGTFVATHAAPQSQYRFLRLRPNGADANALEHAQRELLACRTIAASEQVARALQLDTRAPVLHIERVLRFSGTATILESLWLPAVLFQGLDRRRLAQHDGSIYAWFESEFSVHMVRADEQIRAVLPTERQASLLNLSPDTPLLQVRRTAYSYDDAPVELREGLYCTGDHYYYNQLN